uniref:Sulfhydryl oxidase n=1 Tax=Kalanchoe fedtschenkoi TaxID=63787 RepID=A0A7N0VHW0_KALFE
MVLMARVDCALKLNNKLCDDFSVTHYPMLLWGPPSKFGSGWKPKQDKSDLILIDNGRTADRLLGWINKQLRSSYDLDDEKFENDYLMPSTSDPEQMFCRGSRNNTRGFSCGFWVLLHSLSLRVEDEESQFAFKAICVFIHNFFICEECRLHFYGMCSSVSDPFTKTCDFSLWLWEAHNKVNERLMKEEAALGYNDPNFPKIIRPPEQLCSSCSSHSQKCCRLN